MIKTLRNLFKQDYGPMDSELMKRYRRLTASRREAGGKKNEQYLRT